MRKAAFILNLFFIWMMIISVLPSSNAQAKDKEKKSHIQSKERKKREKPVKLEAKKPKEKKESQTNLKLGQIFFLFNPLITKLHFLMPTVHVVDTVEA